MTWQPLDFQSQQDYAQFIGAFQSRTLPKPRWTHHAHLAAALWYLNEWPPAQALARIRNDIRAYNEAVGGANTDTAGYHETLTQLFMRGVLAHHRSWASEPLLDSLHALLASPLAQGEWPLRFYSKQCLFSVPARLGWVEPDLNLEPRHWGDAEDAALHAARERA